MAADVQAAKLELDRSLGKPSAEDMPEINRRERLARRVASLQ